MSFLNKFRKPAENEETLVNDQEIKDDETTLDVSDDTKPEEPAKDVTNDPDNEEDKPEGISELIALREIVENDKSLESNNPLVKFFLETNNITLESNSGNLLEDIDHQLISLEASKKSILGAIKNTIRDGWVSMRGYAYFKDIYKSPLFSQFKTDDSDIAQYIFEYASEEQIKQIDVSLKENLISADDARFAFSNGKLIDSGTAFNESISAIEKLITTISVASNANPSSMSELLNLVQLHKLSTGVTNSKFKQNDKGITVVTDNPKSKALTFDEIKTWFNSVDSNLIKFGDKIRSLDSKLQAEIKSASKNENVYVKQYIEAVIKASLSSFSDVLRMVKVVLTNLYTAIIKADLSNKIGVETVSNSELKAKATEGKKRFSTGWIIVAFIFCWPVGLYMLLSNKIVDAAESK